MKYLLLSIFFILAIKSFGQLSPRKAAPIINAKDAYNHIGQLVIVQDSIYSGTIVNDSTAVCQIGVKTNIPRLTMVFIGKAQIAPLDQRFVHTFQKYKVEIYGIITGTAQAPRMVIHSGTNGLSIVNIHVK
jgi:hypothetical protein